MKTRTFTFLLTISLMVFITQCETEPETVPEDPIKITDSVFLEALLDRGADKDNDGQISYQEASYVKYLNLDNSGISNMSGIEEFINLLELSCENNQIISLDLTNLTKLVTLRCRDNVIRYLDISNCPLLEELHCYNNDIGTLVVGNNSSLAYLQVSFNRLTSLDLSEMSSLKELYYSNQFITEIDFANNPELAILSIGGEEISQT